MWPFKKKRQLITSDTAASVFSDKIKQEIEQYTIAIDRYAITHDDDAELKRLMDELWIFNLMVLDYVWSVISFNESIRDRIIPMIITGYSKVDHKYYIKQSHVYGHRMSSSSDANIPIIMGEIFSEIIQNDFSGFKSSDGSKMLTGVIAQLMIKTMESYSNLTFSIQKKYHIQP